MSPTLTVCQNIVPFCLSLGKNVGIVYAFVRIFVEQEQNVTAVADSKEFSYIFYIKIVPVVDCSLQGKFVM